VPDDLVALDTRVAANSHHSIRAVFAEAGTFIQVKRNNDAVTGISNFAGVQTVSVSILID